MKTSVLYKFISISLLLLSAFLLTGCTYFDQFRDKIAQEEIPADQFTLSITDETGTSQSYQFDVIEGENLYETLNRAALLNPNVLVEFGAKEKGDDVVFTVSALNGYNPKEDKKVWVFKVNGEKTDAQLTDVFVKKDDQVSFVIE